jgi:hypothetical protein
MGYWRSALQSVGQHDALCFAETPTNTADLLRLSLPRDKYLRVAMCCYGVANE